MKVYPFPDGFSKWNDWAKALIETLVRPIEVGPVQLPIYSVMQLPSAAQAGMQIYVADASGGAVPAFSDGVAWRRVTDRVVVS